MVQLGASIGLVLIQYKQKGWNVLGYDYSSVGIGHMRANAVPCRLTDLNATDPVDPHHLAYQDELRSDLVGPANILAIRLISHLTSEARQLLIFNLIELASPGSVFVIDNEVEVRENTSPDNNKVSGYIASFFAPRTDIAFLFRQTAVLLPGVPNPEEITIMRKR